MYKWHEARVYCLYYYFTWNSNHAGQPHGLSARDLVLIEHPQLVVAAAGF